MSLSAEELQHHCQTIINSSKISNKIIILCEGNINGIKGRVHLYRKLEEFPDANFYKACIPTWWTEKRPAFVPCGDRKDVIDTYFALQKLGINQEKLFAIIDLDLHLHYFDNYLVEDTEQLFYIFYKEGKFQQPENSKHSIFITGLIYKEAYFLIPDLQTVFDSYGTPVFFNDNLANLENIYQTMAQSLSDDGNLKDSERFQRACNRVKHLNQLDFTTISTLQESWLEAFYSVDKLEKQQLIYALLTIHQVKDYWKALKPKDNDMNEERFKEQLTLAIGNFYAKLDRHSEHHLPSFFNALKGVP